MIKKIFIIDVIVSLVKLIMFYTFSVNRDALLEQNYFRLTTSADMDVNCGHCMIVVYVILVPHAERQ